MSFNVHGCMCSNRPTGEINDSLKWTKFYAAWKLHAKIVINIMTGARIATPSLCNTTRIPAYIYINLADTKPKSTAPKTNHTPCAVRHPCPPHKHAWWSAAAAYSWPGATSTHILYTTAPAQDARQSDERRWQAVWVANYIIYLIHSSFCRVMTVVFESSRVDNRGDTTGCMGCLGLPLSHHSSRETQRQATETTRDKYRTHRIRDLILFEMQSVRVKFIRLAVF